MNTIQINITLETIITVLLLYIIFKMIKHLYFIPIVEVLKTKKELKNLDTSLKDKQPSIQEKSGRHTKDINHIALHEAAHFIIGIKYENLIFDHITIKSENDSCNSSGHVLFKPKYEINDVDYFENLIKMVFAGLCMEQLKNLPTCGSNRDISTVKEIIDTMLFTGMFGKEYLGVSSIFDSKDLISKLNIKQRELFNKYYEETMILIKENIEAIEDFSKILIEEETIYHDQLDKILKKYEFKHSLN